MKKDNRTKRIALGILLPLILASFLFVAWRTGEVYLIGNKKLTAFNHEVSILLGVFQGITAYVFAVLLGVLAAVQLCGAQSLFISLLMEYVINPKIENNLIVLLIYGLLGVISGVIVDQLIGETSLIVIGGVTGIIVGKILRDNYNRSPEIES